MKEKNITKYKIKWVNLSVNIEDKNQIKSWARETGQSMITVVHELVVIGLKKGFPEC